MKIEGKRVVLTGGTSGMGRAIALALAQAGAHVVVTGRKARGVEEMSAAHERIEGIVCDLTDDDAVRALLATVDARGGTDLLINNAGVMNFFSVIDGLPFDEQAREVDIDVLGPMRMVHHFLPGMLQRESCIVNISSGLAYAPYAAAPVYSGAKAFVHAWTRSLRRQLRSTSVTVVELLPPVVDTPLAKSLDPSFDRMPVDVLTRAFMAGLQRGDREITPGQSVLLNWLSHYAPSLVFWMLNRGLP